MGNRKHSKIDQLDPAVKETVDEMIKTGALYREIVDYIKQNGMSVSIAAVGRYAKNLMSTLDALRLSQQNFRAIMEETEKYPDLDVTEGILRLLSGQMLDAVSQMNEDQLKDLDFDTLSKHAIALTRAAAYKRKVDIKNKDILENGAEQVPVPHLRGDGIGTSRIIQGSKEVPERKSKGRVMKMEMYVLQVRPGCEEAAAQAIANHGYRVACPSSEMLITIRRFMAHESETAVHTVHFR